MKTYYSCCSSTGKIMTTPLEEDSTLNTNRYYDLKHNIHTHFIRIKKKTKKESTNLKNKR